MKRLYIIALLFLTACVSFAQEKMKVQLANGTIKEYDVSKVSRFYFEKPDPIGVPVDLGLSVQWATYNVGAQAPEQVGDYFAWGEVAPKNGYFTYNYDFKNIGDDITGTEYDAAHVLWGGDWRMPTMGEMYELLEFCSWMLTSINGVSGYKVIGPNGNSIFLPISGLMQNRGLSNSDHVLLWSSTNKRDVASKAFSYDNLWAWTLYANTSGRGMTSYYAENTGGKFLGMAIRPVMDAKRPVMSGEGASDASPKDMTSAILSPGFDDEMYYGWRGTNPRNVDFGCFEQWDITFDNYQVLSGLPEGTYEIRVQGFYRKGNSTDDYYYFQREDVEHNYALLYAESSVSYANVPFVSASSAAERYSIGGSTSSVGDGLFIPNDMKSARKWFDAGHYDDNRLFVNVGPDGVLKFGFKKNYMIQHDWVVVDNWRLFYYGKDSKHKTISVDVATGTYTDVTTTGATAGISIESSEPKVNAGVIVSSKSANFDITTCEAQFMSELKPGDHAVLMDGLKPNTRYYYRACVEVDGEYFYGDAKYFRTLSDLLFELTPANVEVPADGGAIEVELNYAGSVARYGNLPAWISYLKEQDIATGKRKYTFMVEKNGSISPRTGSIMFTTEAGTKSVSVTQAGQEQMIDFGHLFDWGTSSDEILGYAKDAYPSVEEYVEDDFVYGITAMDENSGVEIWYEFCDNGLFEIEYSFPKETIELQTLVELVEQRGYKLIDQTGEDEDIWYTFQSSDETTVIFVNSYEGFNHVAFYDSYNLMADTYFEDPYLEWGSSRDQVKNAVLNKGYEILDDSDDPSYRYSLFLDGKDYEWYSVYFFDESKILDDVNFIFDAEIISKYCLGRFMTDSLSYSFSNSGKFNDGTEYDMYVCPSKKAYCLVYYDYFNDGTKYLGAQFEHLFDSEVRGASKIKSRKQLLRRDESISPIHPSRKAKSKDHTVLLRDKLMQMQASLRRP